jgi:hypothetical protein
MKTFRMVDLVVFLKKQQVKGYHDVNVLLSIITNNNVAPLNKEALMIECLRFCELFESNFFHDNSVYESTSLDFEGEINWVKELPEIPVHTFRSSFLNTRVEFGWIMN